MSKQLLLLLLVWAGVATAGPTNLSIVPATVHSVIHDGVLTVAVVSGKCSFTDERVAHSKAVIFEIDRIPIIYRRSSLNSWVNMSEKEWKENFTRATKSQKPSVISGMGAELLRDIDGKLQAIVCLELGCGPYKEDSEQGTPAQLPGTP